MTDRVYLIWASQGEYSDRSEWPLHAYPDRSSAEYAVERLSALWRELKQKRDALKDDEDSEAYLAEGYDWEWAEKRVLATRLGKEFQRLYGAPGDFSSGYDLNLSCAEIDVRPTIAVRLPA